LSVERATAGAEAGRTDDVFMRAALKLAARQIGRTSPNPAVGCVIVKDGKTIARAATADGGRPHAETQALAKAGAKTSVTIRGGTAYVTFEPCAHFGQTPPCAQSLIDAGIKRVVVGCLDPYPAVRGRGVAMLKRAGIEVTLGVEEAACRKLNEGFITRVTKHRPFVLLKLATTLDGRIATVKGDSKWISSPASRELVHKWRSKSDVVMVGARTIIADNPRLTCRIKGGRDPVRAVFDPHLETPPQSKVYCQRCPAMTVLITQPGNEAKARRVHSSNKVEVIAAAGSGAGMIQHAMRALAKKGWSTVMLEGGAHLAALALDAGVVDRVAFFIAPKILGSGLSAVEGLQIPTMRRTLKLKALSAMPVGDDLLIQAEVMHQGQALSR